MFELLLICVSCVSVFFFKQKTAYEMRISDWSSDVCSADFLGHGHLQQMGMRLAGPVVSLLEIREARRQAVALQHSEEAAPVLAGGDTEEDLGVDQGIEHLEGAGKQRLVMLRSGLQGEEGGAVVLDEMERARALGLRQQAGNGDVQLEADGRADGRENGRAHD